MYWLIYGFYLLVSLEVTKAIGSTGLLADWLVPSSMSLSSAIPLWQLITLACASRLADVASTIVSLTSKFMHEAAPSLGKSPSPDMLLRLGVFQIMMILLAAAPLYYFNIFFLRTALVVITLVSFAATASNVLQFILVAGGIEDKYGNKLVLPVDDELERLHLRFPRREQIIPELAVVTLTVVRVWQVVVIVFAVPVVTLCFAAFWKSTYFQISAIVYLMMLYLMALPLCLEEYYRRRDDAIEKAHSTRKKTREAYPQEWQKEYDRRCEALPQKPQPPPPRSRSEIMREIYGNQRVREIDGQEKGLPAIDYMERWKADQAYYWASRELEQDMAKKGWPKPSFEKERTIEEQERRKTTHLKYTFWRKILVDKLKFSRASMRWLMLIATLVLLRLFATPGVVGPE